MRGERAGELLSAGGIGDGDPVDTELGSLLGEQIEAAATGREPDRPETVGVVSDDVEGLGPDRTGGAEDDCCSLLFFSHGSNCGARAAHLSPGCPEGPPIGPPVSRFRTDTN